MTKLDEMWAALAAYQPQADAAGHGETWARMCSEKKYVVARDAAYSAYAVAAYSAYAAADAAAVAWAQKAIDKIKKITIPAQPAQKPAQQEAIYGMNPDDWKDLTDAVKKVRDGRGMYLACRPADVFQDWFLALGTAKIKGRTHD